MPDHEPFAATSQAIVCFLDALGTEHARAVDVLTLQARWSENVSRTQIEGDTEQRRADRAQIRHALNALALETIGRPFLAAGTLAPVLSLPLDHIPDVAALPPGSRMPLSRNPLFVGREADLKQLAAVLQDGGTAITQIAATTGLGGIGKTNLASEFVHRYGQYFAGGVFWLSFADPASVPAEIAACGVGLELPGFADLKLDDQVTRVGHLWQEPIPRLLIFDNCEDEGLLDAWRPTSGGCRVLVTSRRAHWSRVLNVAALALGVLSRAESIALLHKHCPDLAEDDPNLDAIAAELGDLPLALHLAGSYLETYRDDPKLGSPAAVLAELRDARLLEHAALQGEDVTPSPTNHTLHVGRTFALSYERLRPDDAVDALAIALLARAACFAPGEPIPRDLLLATIEAPDTATQRRASKALRRLVGLGLVETAPEGALRLHRLLAVFVSMTVQDADTQMAVEHVMIGRVSSANRAGDPRLLVALQGHLRYLTDRACAREDRQAAHLCNEFGYHLRASGDLIGARPYYERALAVQRVLEEEHPNTATSLNNLGLLLKDLGDPIGARSYLEQALALRQKVLGEQHPDTATSLNNLGLLLKVQADLVGARVCYEQALSIRRKVLGEQHPLTAMSLNNLGTLFQEMDDLAGAQTYLEQALVIQQRLQGGEHPDTATSLNNLGTLLYAQGNLMGAQSYLEQALATLRQVLGKEHPFTASSLNNLGVLFQEMDDLARARMYYGQALAVRQRVLGEAHPDIAQSLNNLAVLHANAGEFYEAIPLMQRALAVYEGILGSEHPDTQSSRHSLTAIEEDAQQAQSAPPQTREQQIADITQEADALLASALAGDDKEARTTLAEQLEQQAQWAEDGEEPGSPYLTLAAHLRGLIARLREGDADDAAGRAG